MAVSRARAADAASDSFGIERCSPLLRRLAVCLRGRSYGFPSRTSQPVGTLCKRLSCGPGAVLPCPLTLRRRSSGPGAVGRLGRAVLFGALPVSSPSGEPLFALRQLHLQRALVRVRPVSRSAGSGVGARDVV